MGGRGSLSPNAHKSGMYDYNSIVKTLSKSKQFDVVGLKKSLTPKNLSTVVDVLETVQGLSKKHGKLIDTVVFGVPRASLFSFAPNYKVKTKNGEKNLGRALIVPKGTLRLSKTQLETRMNKAKFGVSKSVKEAIYHEYGHAMHQALKKHDIVAYRKLNTKALSMLNKPEYRTYLSKYANTKRYNERTTADEYVAESMVHVLRNTKSKKGQDMIDLTRDYISLVPQVDLSTYGQRRTRGRKPKSPRRIRKKRKS